MNNNTDQKMPEAVISDVKHYVIKMNEDGTETRTEVTEEQVKKDFAETPLE